MKYAPIAIPTLNRYEHFVRCIESLKQNSLSNETDLFISVDYPPSKKYEEGYLKILKYLSDGIEGFRKVKIFYQKKNLGPMPNFLFLNFEVFKYYDRAIFLEDDNELSPCFLEFCNKGLEIFENDETIMGINASSYVWCGEGFKDNDDIIGINENNIKKRQLLFHAWGTWKDKWLKLFYMCDNLEILKYGMDFKIMRKLHKKSISFFYYYIDYVLTSRKTLPWYDEGKIYPIDAIWDIYMLVNDYYIIYPKISQIRDWGMDGTGANYVTAANNVNEISNKKINNDFNFEYQYTLPIEIDELEIQLHDYYQYNSKKVRLIKWIKYLFYIISNGKFIFK